MRWPCPHSPIRKYIGTRTISKKAKNSTRSSELNTPIDPAMRTISQP